MPVVLGFIFSLIIGSGACEEAMAANRLPPYIGLEEEISTSFLSQQGFKEFNQIQGGRHAPFGSRFVLNGRPLSARERSKVRPFFAESHWAWIPPQTEILSSPDQQGRDIWTYPTGTQIVHRIEYASLSPELFEVRMVKKIGEDQWALGTYRPHPSDGTKLQLNRFSEDRYERMATISKTLHLPSGESIHLKFRPINIMSCRRCHFANSPSKYQFSSAATTGPCGFVPANRWNVEKWRREFR